MFLQASSVITRFEREASLGINGSLSGSPGSEISGSGGAGLSFGFSEQPTVTFTPLQGEEFAKRLNKRSTDSAQKIRMRIDKARQEMSSAGNFDLVIINDDLDKALIETKEAIRKFLLSK